MQILATNSSLRQTNNKPKYAASNVPLEKFLSFYNDPPNMELTLDEFEVLSLDRLQLLRAIDILMQSKGHDEKDKESLKKIEELERKYLFSKRDATSRLSDLEKDIIGHFILRLAYCKSEDLRRWFLAQEVWLFKSRLERTKLDQRRAFMNSSCGFDFEQVSPEEKLEKREFLLQVSQEADKYDYFKVPFQQALLLISKRSVYLAKGFAYIPLKNLDSIISGRFRSSLSRALAEVAQGFDFVSSDPRIGPLVKNMNKQFIGNDFSNQSKFLDKLTPDKVDQAAEVNMPLCMKNLHLNLKKEHKLKHWGRLQYGLFLKGAGLDLEGAQQFWETHFTKLMSHDQFVKGYAYSFRHMYGKEGARKNYTPYSCMKIIMGTPPEAGAHHGCPYRHMGDASLSSLLSSLKLSAPDVKEIVATAKGGEYQLACQMHFELTHPGWSSMDLKITDSVATHPNQWFQVSVNYHQIKSGKVPSASSASPSSSSSSSSEASPGSARIGDESVSMSSPPQYDGSGASASIAAVVSPSADTEGVSLGLNIDSAEFSN